MARAFFRILGLSLLSLAAANAQQDRITGLIDPLRTVTLPDSVHPRAQPRYDRGAVDPSTRLGRVTLLTTPSARQQADLDELLREQQLPSSPNYRKWLTPEQFGERFGLSANDMAKLVSWLQSRGFQIEELARARNWVAFSGAAERVDRTFRTAIHRYETDGETHFANSTEVSLPLALQGVVTAVSGLHDFPPTLVGSFRKSPSAASDAAVRTSAPALTPDDIATIYNLKPLFASGIDGAGVAIAVIGMSPTQVDDIRAFRAMFNLPASDPVSVLVGPAPPYSAPYTNESVLDLQVSGAVAPNASLVYVYSANLTDGLWATVDRNLAPIISLSGAVCETDNPFPYLRESIAQQANAQGITWMAGSGDAGAAGCDPFASASQPTATHGLAVEIPAAYPEVTGVGGTQFNGDFNSYWTASGSATGYSALSYVPETSWNQSTSSLLIGTGGGASVLFPKPDWQIGPGVPNDNARDVPDVSLVAYSTSYVTVLDGQMSFTGGGTSASCPAFSGMVALLNQYLVRNGVLAQPGLGNINPALYKLAQLAPQAFHDITTGNNIVPCAPGTPDCATGWFGYSAGPGYDPVTGLGSVDAYQLATHWNNPAPGPVMVLSSASGVVVQNPAADPSCQWSQPLLLQERNGFPVQLTGFSVGAVDLSGQISQLFGTTHLAAYGSLQATVCQSGISPPQSLDFEIEGKDTSGATVIAVLGTLFVAPPSGPPALSASPASVTMSLPDSSASATASIAVSAGAAGAWTASIFPANSTTQWLAISPISGAAPTQLNLTANPSGLANGVYTATIVLKGIGAVPQFLELPVTFVVGASTAIRVDAVTNAASFAQAVAPGMLAAVFGSQLSPSTAQNSTIPLPLQTNGVSVTVNGLPAPLLYLSPGQLNIQIPYEIGAGPAVLAVNVNGQVGFHEFTVAPAAPGIFVQSGSPVPISSARPGDEIYLYLTGEGDVSPFFGANHTPPPSTPPSQWPSPLLPVTVTVGGVKAAVDFIGIPTGLLTPQLNLTIPSSVATGVQPLVVSVGGVPSPPVNLTVLAP